MNHFSLIGLFTVNSTKTRQSVNICLEVFTEYLVCYLTPMAKLFILNNCRITAEGHKGPRPRRISEPSGDEEDLALLTPEERERRKSFEQKRKAHYNEFYAIKMARQLMEEEDSEEDSKPSANSPMDTENS